ncbi:ABC transporter permease subunit [Pseudalkalibacillus berkeleyi]|uniref:ABC transporter permease subunit n=1 Tax=Pseudalkalibacillus berkeleyi TaxID=1069813 RepID=A0ABS9GXT2_9BACL|nr:ABC transporter permease subunit [Pseudalkalibacillus berkeleyi]MCF6136476.1 ABC transporter permease subunit [Pseudalkalibacillus berkeleyi]
MFRTIINSALRLLAVVVGIVLISSFLGMTMYGFDFSLSNYFGYVKSTVLSLIHPHEMMVYKDIYSFKFRQDFYNWSDKQYSVFPVFWDYYFYSMRIFLSALFVAVLGGVLLTYLTSFFSKRIKQRISNVLSLLEALPDIFVIFVVQFFIIWLFKKTDILLFPIAGGFEKVYFVPIVVLSLLPMLFFFKVSLFMTLEEYEQPYVEFAASKGLRPNFLYLKHIFRNAIIGITSHTNSIIWIMLSNLIILERLFNISGLTKYILNYQQTDVIALSLILFYIPIFIILLLSKMIIRRTTGKEVII